MQKSAKELGVNVIEPCKMIIAENAEYEIGIYRTWDYLSSGNTDMQLEKVELYRVTLDGADTMVLAEDSIGAISQASCQQSWKTGGVDTMELKMQRAIACRIPLIIRGWGSRTF